MDNPIKKSVNDSDMKKEEPPPDVVLSDKLITELDTNGNSSKSGGIDDAAITISEKEESKSGGPQLDKQPMNERHRFLIQVRMILRHLIRHKFGVRFSNRCGHWLDRHMSHLVWKYGYWLDYPDGNRVLKVHTDEVYAAAVSTDGRYLFTVQYGGIIMVWDLLDYSVLKQFDAFDEVIYCLIYEHDLLVSVGKDKKIRIFNGITHELIRTLEGHGAHACCLRFNQQCTQIVSASEDKSVKIWCIKTGNCLATLTGHTYTVYSAYFMDNDTKVISGSMDDSMKVWSVADKSECRTINNADKDTIYDMCVNCDSSLVACCSGSKGMIIYNWPSMDIVRRVHVSVTKGQFHPCHPEIIAVTDPDFNPVKIYNVCSGDRIAEWNEHCDQINGFCWSRDGSLLVSVSDDNTVRVWDCTQY